MIYLNREQIESMRIPIREVIEAVEENLCLKGNQEVELPPKPGIHPRKDCFIHAMPAFIGGSIDAAGIKWVSGYPDNLEKGLPYIMGLMILNDAETGAPIAVMDAGWITAYRTGAATAVTAKYMAPENASTIAIIGLGVQGRTHLLALNETLKGLKKVKAYDISDTAARKYLEEMQRKVPSVEIEICSDVKSAVSGSDVVISCTPIFSRPERFIQADWLKNDSLAVAVDYDSAFMAEAMTGASFFVVDDRGQYLWTKEGGEYFNGYPDQVPADMGELCAGTREVPRGRARKSAVLMGIASHDVATAKVIYEKASRTGIGTVLEL